MRAKAGSRSPLEFYGEDVDYERHRHRYEFNCLYEKALTENGLEIVGRSLDGKFVEIVELPTHPCYRLCSSTPSSNRNRSSHIRRSPDSSKPATGMRARRRCSRRRPW